MGQLNEDLFLNFGGKERAQGQLVKTKVSLQIWATALAAEIDRQIAARTILQADQEKVGSWIIWGCQMVSHKSKKYCLTERILRTYFYIQHLSYLHLKMTCPIFLVILSPKPKILNLWQRQNSDQDIGCRAFSKVCVQLATPTLKFWVRNRKKYFEKWKSSWAFSQAFLRKVWTLPNLILNTWYWIIKHQRQAPPHITHFSSWQRSMLPRLAIKEWPCGCDPNNAKIQASGSLPWCSAFYRL